MSDGIQTAAKKQIQDAMRRRGVTQIQLAEKTGISQPSLSRMLRHSNLTTESIVSIAVALGFRANLTFEKLPSAP